MQLYISICIYL